MKKLIKLLFGLAVVFFTLIIAAVVILPLVISPNDYKPQIVEAVKQQTGRDLSIEGEIGLSVFPKIGLTLGRTELSNASGFKEKIFARVERINIQVALMPLLGKRVEMDEIVLEGLVLNLHRNKAGMTNWADLVGSAAKTKKQPGTAEGVPFELAALSIGGIRVKDAKVHWQDDRQGQQYTIQNFNLTSGPLIAGDPVDLELESDFSSGQPRLQGHVMMSTTLHADVDQSRFVLNTLRLVLDASSEVFPGGKIHSEVTVEQVAVQLTEQTLVVKKMSLNMMGMRINGNLSANQILSDNPQLSGHIQVPTFNARDVIKLLGQPMPEMADPDALTRVAAGFDLGASSNQASLNKLQLQLDDTSLKGNVAVHNFANPVITFDLNIDKIDLDRYLPAPKESSTEQSAQIHAGSADQEAELFPLETLRKLNANGVVRIGEVRKNKITAKDVVIKFKANAGQINFKPSARLYQGTYDADVTVDARSRPPQLNVEAKLNGVQIEPLLKDLQGKAQLAGRTDATVKIHATGNTQSAIKRTLNGHVTFSFQDGALVGVNIAKIIREGWARVQGRSVPKTNEPDKTDFSELKGSAKITNGVLDNRDFIMKSPLLRVTGAGQADLVREQLDYLLKVSIVGSLQGQGGEKLSTLKGVTIPVRVKGPFDQPSYKPDLSAALSDTVKQKVKERVEKKKEGIKQKFQDKLKEKFKGLF